MNVNPEPHKSTSASTLKALKAELAEARAQIAAKDAEIERLTKLANYPHPMPKGVFR
jgi:hypothetical protein